MPFYMFKIREEYLTVEAPGFEEALEQLKDMGRESDERRDENDLEDDVILSAVTPEAPFCQYGPNIFA